MDVNSTNGVVNAVFGAETSVHLKDFAERYPIPNLVKVTKGQYRNIGVAKSVHNELYLHSVRTCPKVLAEGVKVKDSKKSGKKAIVTSDQKYALPISYQGWWELLSADGKAIRPIATVSELSRVFPAKALVREPIKALVTQAANPGDLTLDRTRMLHSGEQLTLVGDSTVNIAAGKGGTAVRRMLRCLDSQGDSVFLGLEQKGLFSPIAGQGNISGVHSMSGLVEKFRLPVLVRLVHGIIPMRLERNSFTGVFRLLGIYQDETAFVMPLRRDAKMVPISTREPLKISPANNFELLKESEEVVHYEKRCGRMIASYLNSIHVLVNPPDISAISKPTHAIQEMSSPSHAPSVVPTKQRIAEPKTDQANSVEENILFEEVDDIYVYVREGGLAPPPRPRPPNQNAARVDTSSHHINAQNWEQHVIKSPAVVQTKPMSPLIREYGEMISSNPSLVQTGTMPLTNDIKSANIARESVGDDNYWEEPIYDEIEKFQRKIREQRELKQHMTMSMEVLSRPEVSSSSDNYQDNMIARSPVIDSNPAPTRNDPAVHSLRQTYKLKEYDSSGGSRPSSLEKSEDELSTGFEILPPPLPPKRFDETDLDNWNESANSQSNSFPRRSSTQSDTQSPSKSLPRDNTYQIKNTSLQQESTTRTPFIHITPPTTPEKEVDVNYPKTSNKKTDTKKEADQKQKDSAKKLKELKLKEEQKLKELKLKEEQKSKELKLKEEQKSKKDSEAKKKEGSKIKLFERRKSSEKRKDETVSIMLSKDNKTQYGLKHQNSPPVINKSSPPVLNNSGSGASLGQLNKSSSGVSLGQLNKSPSGASLGESSPKSPDRRPSGASVNVRLGFSPTSPPIDNAGNRKGSIPGYSGSSGTSVTVHSNNSSDNLDALHAVYSRSNLKSALERSPGARSHDSRSPQHDSIVTDTQAAYEQRTAPGTHTQHIALTSANTHMGKKKPQYVAIARVGSDDKGNGNDKSNSRVGNIKKQIQSIYL